MAQVTRKDDLGTLTDLGASIRLTGALLTIGGRQYKIDQLDEAYAGLVEDTTYSVYVTAVSQTPALVISTTAPVIDYVNVGSFLYKNSTVSINSTANPPYADQNPGEYGMIKLNKIQTKQLGADRSNTAAVGETSISFSNLVVGKWYRISAKCAITSTSGAADQKQFTLAFQNNSLDVLDFQLDETVTTISYAFTGSNIFKATSTTLQAVSHTNRIQLKSAETFATLEEVGNVEETTDFT